MVGYTEGARLPRLPAGRAIQEIVTVEASTIRDAFGKLPGTVPTVHDATMYLQAQHLDVDFYDEFFGSRAPTCPRTPITKAAGI